MLTKLISTNEFLPQGSEPGRDRVYELDSSGGLIIRGNFVTERRSQKYAIQNRFFLALI
jgi:hypothetical protein